jgi:hypothetical protein
VENQAQLVLQEQVVKMAQTVLQVFQANQEQPEQVALQAKMVQQALQV